MLPEESGKQAEGEGEERKQCKGVVGGKGSGKLQLIPQGNSEVEVMPQSCPTRGNVPMKSYPGTCKSLVKH